jgi:hypothetical protein
MRLVSWAAHIFGAGWEAREASLPCLQTQRGAGSISWLVQLDIFTNNGPESFSTNGTATLGPHLQGERSHHRSERRANLSLGYGIL